MEIEYVPLLALQRELYAIPRGRVRFDAYLATMRTEDESDLRLPPLVLMNPMGKEHVPAMLDQLIALGADRIAASAAAEASARLVDVPGKLKLGVVVSDDWKGGWTNRFASELSIRFGMKPSLERGWVSAVLWTSETQSAASVRTAVLEVAHRAAHVARHGYPRDLREMLVQEGQALLAAESPLPALDAAELEYTRAVITPLLDAKDSPTVVACLFGDAAARTLGFQAQGLGDRAGLALAVHDARVASERDARRPS